MKRKWRTSKAVYGREWDPITREHDPNLDEDHLSWLRSLPCAVVAHPLPGATRCRFRIHAHHPRWPGTGMGLKAPDTDAIPMCLEHHEHLHKLVGAFDGFTEETVLAWQRAMSALYRALGDLRKGL